MTEPAPFADDAPTPPDAGSSKLRWCCGPLVALGVALGVVAALGQLHMSYSKGRVKAIVARLEADGLGVGESLHPKPGPDNGSPLLEPALESMQELSQRPEEFCLAPSVGLLVALREPTAEDSELYAPNPIEEGGPQNVVEGVALLCARADACEPHVDAALQAPTFRFPIDWSQGAFVDLPHMLQLKSLVNLFGTRAIRRQLDGDAARAWEDVLRMARLAGLEDEPLLISRLVRLALIGITTATVEALLQAGPPPGPGMLTRLDDHLADLEHRAGFTVAMRGELNMGLQMDPKSVAGFAGVDIWILKLPVVADVAFSHFMAELAEMEAEIIRASTLPPHQARRELLAIQQRARQGSPLVLMMIPAIEKAQLKELQLAASLRMARTALRVAHGPLPAELPAPVFSDPMSPAQNPLRWRREGPREGVLWSVGRDLQDDNGQFFDPDVSRGSPSDPGWDVPFRIKLPAQQGGR